MKKTIIFILLLISNSCSRILKDSIDNNIVGNKLNILGEWDFLDNQTKPDNFYIDKNIIYNKKIRVPSNWYLQGYDFSGKGIYRKKFNLENKLKNKYITLNFESVDYTASVWLNGKYLGFHEGNFKNFSFNVSNILNFYNENELIVIVDSPFEPPNQNWSLNKKLIKGIFNHHDTRPGGAWDNIKGQDKNTGGIIGDVFFKISEKLSIDYVKYKTKINFETNKSDLNIEVGIYSDYDLNNIRIKSLLKPKNFITSNITGNISNKIIHIKKGFNKVNLTIENSNTYLWWSWDYGEQNLYNLSVSLFDDSKLLDYKSETVAFKEIVFDVDKNIFILNKKNIFFRGTNYISSQWLSEMSSEKYTKDVLLMKEANINTVRVHAHIEKDDFYDYCDKYGIMVWQDFPLQWGYSDDLDFQKEASKQLIEMVDFLNNHPSIIAWSIHNEPPWDAYWMKYKYINYNPKQNIELDDNLYKTLVDYDNQHYIHKYSSTKEHPWFGWYSGSWKDYLKQSNQALITEYGAQALPNIDSLKKIFTINDLWPDNEQKWDKWAYHNFQRNESFNIAKIKKGDNIDEFISNTQNYQANLIKIATESYRRQKYRPINGIFQFMFVENWPSINWGILDYWRNKKQGYNALKDSFQPILPSLDLNKFDFKKGDNFDGYLWIINDLNKNFEKSKLIYTLTYEEKILQYKSLDIYIDSNSSSKFLYVYENNLNVGKYKVDLKIIDEYNNTLGKNTFEFNVKS